MRKSLVDQVVVVTGASSGIGWALAKRLVQEGCKVGLVARRQDKLQALAGDIKQAGGSVAWSCADVADRAQTVAAIHDIAGQLGPVDLLIANAGIGIPTLVKPLNTPDMEQMFRVNVLGVIYCIEAVLPTMLQRRQGHLVAVSSVGSYKGLPGESGYCASKSAVNIFMEGLRIYLRGKGIAVTTLCPGFVKTPMTDINNFPMPWLLSADDAARRMIGAIRQGRKVYNFPWQTSLLMKLTRWLPDSIVARAMGKYNEAPPMP